MTYYFSKNMSTYR
ncbi:hypothetical protein KCP77_12010 [Salmonella enterica subsp. enterica]|nr:hypothetical protein KCP77_12010 [Salmonella enterica subsp. enterica]